LEKERKKKKLEKERKKKKSSLGILKTRKMEIKGENKEIFRVNIIKGTKIIFF
jgi:hypothetical protein